jgi:tRNA modification GTPase
LLKCFIEHSAIPLPDELLALDLREALHALGEVTGETTPDDILDLVFGQFCIGK